MWDLGSGGDFDVYGINRDNGAIVVLLSSYLHEMVTPLGVFNWSMRVDGLLAMGQKSGPLSHMVMN